VLHLRTTLLLPRHDGGSRELSTGGQKQLSADPSMLTWDQWMAFEERAAIGEFDGGLDRAEAERRALAAA
jgi:hypothetical protein